MYVNVKKQLRDFGIYTDCEAAMVVTCLIWSGGAYIDELCLVAHEQGYVIERIPRADKGTWRDMGEEDYE